MSKLIKGTALFGKFALLLMLAAMAGDIIMQGELFPLLEINSTILAQGKELWRLFTFPFAMDSVPSAFLFVFVFLVMLPQLSGSIPKQLIVPISMLLVSFQSIVFSLVFWDTPFLYRGMDGASIFYLVFMAMIMPQERIFIMGRRLGKVFHITALVFVVWVSAKLISIELVDNRHMEVLRTISSVMFGFIAASLVYAVVKGFHFFVERKEAAFNAVPTIPPEKLQQVYAENFSATTETKARTKSVRERDFTSPVQVSLFDQISQDTEFTQNDEMIMDMILDKISQAGKESLNKDEKDTLLYLSQKLDLRDARAAKSS